MKQLLQPKASLLTIKYQPDGETISENPPRFSWMPENEEDLIYQLQLSPDADFPANKTETIKHIPYNFCTLDHPIEPGEYYWRYRLDDESTDFSQVRHFIVSANLPQTPLANREKRYQTAELSHPRIWLNQNQINDVKERLKIDPDYCGFQRFYQHTLLNYSGQKVKPEPPLYPNHIREVDLWRNNYMDCQEVLIQIRSLIVAGIIQEDQELVKQAKEACLEVADWDLNGSTSRSYNDECAFRIAYILAFSYDWLYHVLAEEEKKKIYHSLWLRTKQVADHVIKNSRIHLSLYDSHAVRSLSSVLTPCCIAMLGEGDEAKAWLDYTIEYFNVIYSPWGAVDGGWAEGPMYWTTGMAFVIEALNMIKNFTGIDSYQRPFFQKTGDFIYYCYPPNTYRASFCDQSNLGSYPGHKTACNMRQFAGVTGKKNYHDYYEAVFKREPEIDHSFYNRGWWDFNFDDLVYAHDYQHVELTKYNEVEEVKWFQDIGWVAINRNMNDDDKHLFFLMKSSPYGSVSHSHGDQNDFLLFAFGEPLLVRSGYYIGFNTSMHIDWRRQTKSHNTILIDRFGQYAGMDKAKQLTASGLIETVVKQPNYIYIRANATAAYQHNVPYLQDYTREIYFVEQTYFVIVDSVETSQPATLNWLLHSLNKFELTSQKFSIVREKARLDGRFIYCSSGIEQLSQNNCFDGVAPHEISDLDPQWHLSMNTGMASKHLIVTLLIPSKNTKENIVTTIKDDQGHDIYFYFNHDGKIFSLKTDGNKRY